MTQETGPQARTFENRWPAPVRFTVYGAVAAALALVLARLAAWQGLENGILIWHGPDRPPTLIARPGLWTRPGLQWLAADMLCLFPWALAAFSRSPRLAPRGALTSSVRTVLWLGAMAIFFSFFGQSVRKGGTPDWENIHRVLATLVAFLPPVLAFQPGLLWLGRLRTGGFGALVLILPLVFLCMAGAPALFQPTLYLEAGHLRLFPPSYPQGMDVLAPMLGIWGLFTMLEIRFEAAARRK